MKKKRLIFLPAVLTVVLLLGITALAAIRSDVCKVCGKRSESGSHLWHAEAQHTVEYNDENGKKQEEKCTIAYSEDEIWVVCPNGHGTIWKGTHYVERHSSSHCNSIVREIGN